jgi:hypothetical protein
VLDRRQVRAALDSDEPDYVAAAGWGIRAIPYLRELLSEPDALLVSKAIHLAGLIGDGGAARIVRDGSRHSNVVVRIAAAHAAKNLARKESEGILKKLLRDRETGVVRAAIQAVRPGASAALRKQIDSMRERGPNPLIRQTASSAARRLGR